MRNRWILKLLSKYFRWGAIVSESSAGIDIHHWLCAQFHFHAWLVYVAYICGLVGNRVRVDNSLIVE